MKIPSLKQQKLGNINTGLNSIRRNMNNEITEEIKEQLEKKEKPIHI